MSIHESWPRMAAIDLQKDGTMGAVWIARDPITDVAHLYDCCLFERESEVVIAHGLNARGRWLPISWEKSARAMSDKLLDLGCNMMPEPCADDDAMAEVISRNIWTRMRSHRLRVARHLSEWTTEFKNFRRTESKVPREGFPLMSATRHAFAVFDEYALPQSVAGATKKDNFPKLAVI